MSSLLDNYLVDNGTIDSDNGSMKSFLSACGLTDSLQLVVESQSAEEGELRLLHQPFAVIGRDPRADIVLDHTRVSRRHAYLQIVNGRAFWVDLDSRSGTQGDGQSQRFGWLEGGRTLGVGPFVIRRFVGDSLTGDEPTQGELPYDAPLVAQAHGHQPLPEVALEFLNGPSQSTAWPVRRVMSLIGSASGCKFRLTDVSVSRFHGSLLRTSTGLWIVDLLGQNGIAVNDVPVRFSHLTDGDVLGIGRYQIRVQFRSGSKRPGSGLSEHRCAHAVAGPPSHGRKGLMYPNWAAAAPALKPGTAAANGASFPLAIAAGSSLPKVEVMASQAAFPLKLAPSELSESMLVPLVNQFGLMQQQMFDQFQQAMAMMVQMFGTMHRDQMEAIRAELAQLHELTEEFHALKQELADRTREQDHPVLSKDTADRRDLNPSASTDPSVAAGARAFGQSNDLKAGRADATSAVQSPMSASAVPGQRTSPDHRTSSMPPLANSSAAQPHSEGQREPDTGFQPKTDGASSPADSERNSILWLHERITALQRERETRWQKILKLLPGMS
jgi:pSer/pThr/pTyr-binding forkhead associated (FHA) protein